MGNCFGKKPALQCNEISEKERIQARITHIEQQLNTNGSMDKATRSELKSSLLTYKNRYADLTWGNLTLDTLPAETGKKRRAGVEILTSTRPNKSGRSRCNFCLGVSTV